ncbi:hypothetical protein CRG98_036676 [Punica granatum]|uniref:Uncharacterized protein n=1 Tax=Punica granatum TaxID=22663 RepID=A0A2I0IFX6_PUNGR|nr:hypothetical protein CRG98_036676 [Punica granatum]
MNFNHHPEELNAAADTISTRNKHLQYNYTHAIDKENNSETPSRNHPTKIKYGNTGSSPLSSQGNIRTAPNAVGLRSNNLLLYRKRKQNNRNVILLLHRAFEVLNGTGQSRKLTFKRSTAVSSDLLHRSNDDFRRRNCPAENPSGKKPENGNIWEMRRAASGPKTPETHALVV